MIMRFTRKTAFLFLFAALFLSTQAAWAQVEKARQIKVVASFYPMYIMAKNVVKDVPGVSLESLTSPFSGCLHDYTLTTQDMKKLAHAQVFVANGAGMESFLGRVITQYPGLKIIELSRGVALIKGSANTGDNPHVWVSISDAIREVKNLGRALAEYDPPHKELYEKNTAAYVVKLEILREKMHKGLAPYQARPMITFHEAFPYFAREFGFKIVAVVEREPGSEPSARELADTIKIIKKNNIAALFSEPQYPAAAARVIAQETGARVYVLDPAVTGPDDADAYIKIMENNLATLKRAFTE
ncbi:MAG: metal ABC transporter substrate-binding protein [Candidatus Omnitrophica bacterium]|nr:metal ABC transporter substrate-binding protein [Candidatus Omnitrophota bacterium]MDD5611187.1 metal ABC transporter substrate-binding protein [Candidatus Omnitrophota bacterium]